MEKLDSDYELLSFAGKKAERDIVQVQSSVLQNKRFPWITVEVSIHDAFPVIARPLLYLTTKMFERTSSLPLVS